MACTNCKLALGGVMRGGAHAGCLTSAIVGTIDGIRIDGPNAPTRILIASLSIQDALNEVANTAIFTVRGVKPREGAEVILAYQSINNGDRLFAGHLTRVTQTYAASRPDLPQNLLWQCEATDYTWNLNANILVARYRGQSATAIVKDLVATWAPAGYTTRGVAEGLPYLDEITMTNTTLMDAIRQVAQRIGGYAEVDYFRDVHLWIADPYQAPRALTFDHPTLSVDRVTYARDLTQIVTRVLVEGGGGNTLAPIAPGGTSIPIQDPDWYDPAGGLVVSGPQRIRYGSVTPGGAGTLVGPGVTPTTAPTLGIAQGAGVDPGSHSYAYTFVTGTGETLPSPIGTIATGTIGGPPAAPTGFQATTRVGNKTVGRVYEYAYAYSVNPAGPYPYDLTGLTAPSPILAMQAVYTGDLNNPGRSAEPSMAALMTADTRIQTVWPLMRPQGETVWAMLGAGIPNQPQYAGIGFGQYDYLSDAQYLNQVKYPGAHANVARVLVSAIAVGPPGTLIRKLYRSAANKTAPLKLIGPISDNTTTTYTDAAADATLGAVAPVSDASGLQMPAGVINAGATTIRVANTQPFSPTGGWALVGTQAVHYSGITATDIVGIPPSGDGSLQASVPYNTVVIVAAELRGIPASGDGAIRWALLQGDPVNLLVIENDLAAQAALQAAIGGDGIHVAYVQDRRISLTEAHARGRALLAEKSTVLETIRYRVRDKTTRTAATIHVDLTAPQLIAGYFKIQSVTISRFHPIEFPVYDVLASSSRFSFEDLLRRQRGGVA